MKKHRISLRNSLIGAASFLIATLLMVAAKRAGLIGPEVAERSMGVLFGLYFIIIGNYMPKTLDPPTREQCMHSRKQALQRFSGRVFVIMGLGYLIVWLILPGERAGTVAMFVVAPAAALVLGRTAWLYFTCKRVQPKAEV